MQIKNTSNLLTILLLLLICPLAQAEIHLPAIFGSNMVLQQKENVKIWGSSIPNKKIKLKSSWNNTTLHTVSDSEGKWEITFPTPQAGGPYTIMISDGKPLFLENVLIGEVWFCSGQSNMEMPLKGFRGQPVAGAHQAILQADIHKPLRLFTVKRAASKTPLADVTGSWELNSSEHAAPFSATAYFFGSFLQQALQIPVGLIHASWSASKIEAWMDPDTLRKFPEVDMSVLEADRFEWPAGTPSLLYQAMVKPLEGVRVRGLIWYQGESNSANPELYSRLFPAWINQNRRFFKNDSLPVYYTEIAPYKSADADELNLPYFRESQLESMKQIPYVGMAFTNDLGNLDCIHPPHKRQVGERLAYWALAKTYQKKGIGYCGPIMKSGIVKDGKVEVLFSGVENGLNPENKALIGFEIAGNNGVFVPAQAKVINGSSRIAVWNDLIADPQEVRYCFRNYQVGNLTDNFGIPAAAFRLKLE